MSEKFYKLVDGNPPVLWADWPEPKSENFELSSDWMFAWKKYESRPHYPLSGTLEGEERYELGVDFEIITIEVQEQYDNGEWARSYCEKEVAIPIAQPVGGEKEEDVIRQELLFLMRENKSAMEAAKKKNWTDILTTQNPFDCIIETYEDLISIIENLPLKRQPHYQPFIDKMNNQGTEPRPPKNNSEDVYRITKSQIEQIVVGVLDGDYIHTITNRKELLEYAKKAVEEEISRLEKIPHTEH